MNNHNITYVVDKYYYICQFCFASSVICTTMDTEHVMYCLLTIENDILSNTDVEQTLYRTCYFLASVICTNIAMYAKLKVHL